MKFKSRRNKLWKNLKIFTFNIRGKYDKIYSKDTRK